MKTCLFAALTLIGLLQSFGFGSDTLEIKIAVPTNMEGPSVSHWDKTKTHSRDHFHILLTNTAKTTQRIWQDGNSWGFGSLSFELTDEKGERTVATRTGGHAWTRNWHNWWPLAPGEAHVFDVYWADPEDWTGFPSEGSGRHFLTVRAIYGIPPSPESKEDGVWTGKTTSKPVRVLFSNPK